MDWKGFTAIALLAILAQGLTWIQVNGQLVWPIFKQYKYAILLLSYPIGYLFWNVTQYGYPVFDNQLWPIRFLVFVSGICTFVLFTTWLLEEPFTFKIAMQLLLCVAIICIQLFWK